MSRFFVRQANATDNEELVELSKVAIEGQISLALERCPDFFTGAKVQNESVEVNLICDRSEGDRIAAVFSTGRRKLFVNSVAPWVRYLSDVRISPEYRGRRPLRMINNCIIEREASEPSATIQSVMFSDNNAIRDVVRRPVKVLRRLKYLWFYDVGVYRTSAISLTTGIRAYKARYSHRRATPGDREPMQAFFDKEAPRKQFYPQYRFDQLDEPHYAGVSIDDYFLAFDGAELIGITGVWDQSAFKQTRIVGYGGALRWLRPVLNMVSRVMIGFSLPPPGTELNYIYLHTIVTRENSVEIFRDLVEHIYETLHGQDYLYFLCGLFTHDPLIEVLDSFRSRRDISGQHYQVSIDELEVKPSADSPLYVEAARI